MRKWQVFVSSSTKDRHAAEPIIEAIKQAGLSSVFSSADYDISPGYPWPQQIENAIISSRCLVVLWSKAAAQSEWLQHEIYFAIRAWSSDSLVLAALDDAPLPMGLRDLSAIQIRNADDSGTKQLIERARAIVGTEEGSLDGSAPRVALGSVAPPPEQAASAVPIRKKSGGLRNGPASHRFLTILNRTLLVLVITLGLLWFAIALRFATTQGPLRYLEGPLIWRLNPSAPGPAPAPAPAPPEGAGPSVLLMVMVLALGVGLGAGTIWSWTVRSRSRSTSGAFRGKLQAFGDFQPAQSNSASQVFISYSRKDERDVEQLVQQIDELGYAIWMDRQSAGSQRYAAQIVHAIRTSRLVALMCSKNAFASDHVIREIYVAGDYKKPFIAFQLDSSVLPDEILYFVSGFPRIPVTNIDPQQLRSEIARLVEAMSRQLTV
jgi:hypothetical protein